MNTEFRMAELRRAIAMSRDMSSPGLDKIDYKIYKMLKNLPDGFLLELLFLLNHAFLSGQLYKEWKEVQTIHRKER